MSVIQGYSSVLLKFTDNVQATVSVKLVNGDSKHLADVYGTIASPYSIEKEIVLFDFKQHNYIPMRPGEYIPLIGPEVNVPSEASYLIIRAYLMVSDHEIANGFAQFSVKEVGKSDTRPIYGEYGSVEVTVVWG